MHIDIRVSDRLRGKNAVNLAPALAAVANAVKGSSFDPTKLRFVFDWVQYRTNFREPVSARSILPAALSRGKNGASDADCALDALELGIDLRRAASLDLDALLANALNQPGDPTDARQYLEDWGPINRSLIWQFNSLYWNALGLWEQATGREYEQALPSGESDARNVEAARTLILELFSVWDGLAKRRALPEDLHVIELGVGNGNQARVWLDEFLRLDRKHGSDYYHRLHYLMGDYSPHVLERARENVAHHADRVSGLVIDARSPSSTLRFLRSKAFLIYISNVYDNLPTDEFVRIGGQLFNVETRAYLPASVTEALSTRLNLASEALPDLVRRLLELGPELLARSSGDMFANGVTGAVEFWRDVWEGLCLDERFVPVEGLDAYVVAPGISGEILRPVVEANGDLRMHVSNGAAESMVDSLQLLHPFGLFQCHDLFVTDIHQYETGFRGPGKYDGSVVNWINGPVLAAIARRRGFDLRFESFAHRSGSNITTLTARVQE